MIDSIRSFTIHPIDDAMIRTAPFASFPLPCCLLAFVGFLGIAADSRTADLPTEQPWGRIVWKEQSLELHVTKVPSELSVSIPRLNNRLGQIYLQGTKPADSTLKLQPEITTWKISLPQDLPAESVIMVEMLEPICLAREPHVVEQDTEGTILLPAHHAVTHGALLRYEPQPHKNTIGYWANEKDWAEWKFKVDTAGEYDLEVWQGCGKGQGGSKVSIEVAQQTIEWVVEDTGHFQNFQPRQVGRVQIAQPGVYSLQVRAIQKAKGAVCDIRQIRLTPK